MANHISNKQRKAKTLLKGAVLVALAAIGTAANAQVDRRFISPHEYALPVDFKPFNIFVQYATLQNTRDVWDSGSHKNRSASNSDTMVGLTKYVRLWTPEFSSKVGLAWEVIVPEVGVRDKTARTSTGGMGDPITGFAAWYKPADNWTLGTDLFVSVPVGDKAVGGGDRWDVLGSIFWDAQFDKVNYVGNFGYHFNGDSVTGSRPADYWHLNNRLGYRATGLLEPYIGLDYQNNQAVNGNPGGHETAAVFGVMFHTYDHSSIAVHYSKGIEGSNAPVSNNLNVKFAYVF